MEAPEAAAEVGEAGADGAPEEGEGEGAQLEGGDGADAEEAELEGGLEDGDAGVVDNSGGVDEMVAQGVAPDAELVAQERDVEGAGVEEVYAEDDADGEAGGSADMAAGEDEGAGAEEGEAALPQDGHGVSGGGMEEEVEGAEELGDELIAEDDIGQEAAEDDAADVGAEEDGADALADDA